MDVLIDFLDWAWARHANPLSWYIRPLFILPFCYFAYRRSLWGMALTIVAVTLQHVLVPCASHSRSPRCSFLGRRAPVRWRAMDVEQDSPDGARSDLVRRAGVGRSTTLLVGSGHGDRFRDSAQGWVEFLFRRRECLGHCSAGRPGLRRMCRRPGVRVSTRSSRTWRPN